MCALFTLTKSGRAAAHCETGAQIRLRLGRSKLPLQEAFRAAVFCPPASVSANSNRNSFRQDRRESGLDFARSQCSQRRMSSHKRITYRSAGKRSNGSPSRVGAASFLTDGGSGNADRTSSSVRSQNFPRFNIQFISLKSRTVALISRIRFLRSSSAI